MLTPEIMGLVALWVLWGNTILVALAALKRARALSRRAARVAGARRSPEAGSDCYLEGRVAEVLGDHLAAFSVDQLGRAAAGKAPAILWHDKSYRSEVAGGRVDVAGASVHLEAGAPAEVWLGADEADAAADCADRASFEAAFTDAKKTRGAARTVTAALGRERRVFLFGRVSAKDGRLVFTAPEGGRLLVAALDPVVWLRRRARFARWIVVPAMVLGAAACTALALQPPVFEGVVSRVGGLLGLVFFLLVLPAGTSLRDFLRVPSERIVRGRWEVPPSAAAEAYEARELRSAS